MLSSDRNVMLGGISSNGVALTANLQVWHLDVLLHVAQQRLDDIEPLRPWARVAVSARCVALSARCAVRGGECTVRSGAWWCAAVRGGECTVRGGAWWCVVVRGGARWCAVVRGGARWCA
eukprot:3966031-Prymnesium_polylepis.1